jgi:ABC-type transport system substrate-binding protein
MAMPVRRIHGLFTLTVIGLAVLISVGQAGDEEEETIPKKGLKKVIVPEDDIPSAGANALPDVVRAASTNQPVLKKYFSTLSVACDRITVEGKTLRVLPLPLVWPQDKDRFPKDGFGVRVLNSQNRPGDIQTVMPKDVRSIIHFEPFVLSETEKLLTSTATDYPPMSDRWVAAERVLSATLFFHDSALESGIRRGASWEPFKTGIVDKLTEVRLAVVRQAAESQQWPKLRELVARYSERYRNNPKVIKELLALRLFEAIDLCKSEKLADLEAARDILFDFEGRFPNTGNEQAKQVRMALAAQAKKYLEEANSSSGSDAARRNLLKNVEALDPDAPGLRKSQQELKAGYATLVVGVKRMPRRMSPATAREDSERMAVELLFEALVEPTPDAAFGTIYRPELAAFKPGVPAPLAREVTLVGNAEWGRPEASLFDAADLVETVRLMREKRILPTAGVTDWLDSPTVNPINPQKVRLKLRQGHPDPRTLLGFKLLPGKYLAGKNRGIDDDEFARMPFGTGPFKLAPGFQPAEGIEPVKQITFIPNTNYGRRPGKIGQPAIKEIRFVPMDELTNPVNEFVGDRLHLATDVPTRELDRYAKVAKVTVNTPLVNRRIYLLAINHASLPLQSVEVRRGLMHAIDRETILNEVFRAGKKEFHKALTGPFPIGCWQERRPTTDEPITLFHRDLATAKLRGLADSVNKPLSLLFPNDDPQVKQACELMKVQIEGCGRVEIELEAVAPAEFWTRVQLNRNYDLAYLPFDYPDVFYSHALAAFLDPTAAGRDGRNFLNYLLKSTNPSKADMAVGQMLSEIQQHRDYTGELGPLSQELAERFNTAVPFIPLWQLDRHIVCSKNLKIFLDQEKEPSSPQLLDPIRVFHNPSRWQMDDGR